MDRRWALREQVGGLRPAVLFGSRDPLLEWSIHQSRSGLATLLDGSRDGSERSRAGEGAAHVHNPKTGAWHIRALEAGCAGENAVPVALVVRHRVLVVREVPFSGESPEVELSEPVIAEVLLDGETHLVTGPVINEPNEPPQGFDRGGSGNLNSRDEWIFRATAA